MLCSLPSAIFYPDNVECSDRPMSSALTQLRPIKTFLATSRRRSEVRNLGMRHRLEVQRGDLRILHHGNPEVRDEIICDLVGHLRGGGGTDHQLGYVELSGLVVTSVSPRSEKLSVIGMDWTAAASLSCDLAVERNLRCVAARIETV